ncbi:MAG TPA: NUDIX domain-containing protein [Candidatus Saccharimonadales bacterium]|nr:NUDIX domain-containing protein [Candidatus Saccharimonadales bacterium]
MAHIHTKDNQHDLTVCAYIVRTDVPNAPAIMMHQHRLLKQWLQFGGHVELDETPWHALVRELAEESGYSLTQLRILQPRLRPDINDGHAITHPMPASLLTHRFANEAHFHTDISFAFTTNQPPRGTIAPGESTTMRCFNRDEIAALPKGTLPENVRYLSLFVLDTLLGAWEQCDPTHWPTRL